MLGLAVVVQTCSTRVWQCLAASSPELPSGMWSKSFRSNEFSTQDIDLMEEASGVASSSNHDVKEDCG